MKENKELIIGLFGFGVVGSGLHQVLQDAKNANATIKTICVRDITKERNIPEDNFTTDANKILNDPEINLVVELIDDHKDAYNIVKSAMQKGKSVVSANKRMLAYHLEELIKIQNDKKVALLYDASACGSIPIIRNLEEYYDIDLLQSVTGILNGSSNFILTKMFNENQPYHEALKQAQELGFAESNPISDVGGFDSLYKLIIITLHSFGIVINPDKVTNYGIQTIKDCDIIYAKEKNCKIKLIAQVERQNNEEISLYVMPKLIDKEQYTYNVDDEFNGVVIQGKFYDKQFIFGKGAGGTPTATSVLSDISARKYGYKYEYKKKIINKNLSYTSDVDINIYLRYSKQKDRDLFHFTEIYEHHTGKESNYVTGKIKLKILQKLKETIAGLDIFLAVLK